MLVLLDLPTRSSLRRFLYRILGNSEGLRHLCLDHFQELVPRLSSTTDLLTGVNMLFEQVDTKVLLAVLRSESPWAEAFESYRSLIEYEAAPTPLPASSSPAESQLQPPGCAYDSRWYVARLREEQRALARLRVGGGAVVIQAPKWFGKTWFIQHLSTQSFTNSCAVALSPSTLATIETMASFDGFLRAVLRQIIAHALGCDAAATAEAVAEAWRYTTDPVTNINHFMEARVLPQIGQVSGRSLILVIDNAEELAERSYMLSFFRLLRGWMDRGIKPPWSTLRLLLGISKSPMILLKDADANHSPFNIAQTIELGELNSLQLASMAEQHGLSWSEADSQTIQADIGGHPYLARLALYEMQLSGQPLAQLLQPGSPLFSEYLTSTVDWMRRNPSMREAFVRVLADPRTAIAPDTFDRLYYAGLLIQDDITEEYRPRYRLLRRLGRGRFRL